MRNPRIVRQTWNLGNEQRDPRIEQIPGLRVTYILIWKISNVMTRECARFARSITIVSLTLPMHVLQTCITSALTTEPSVLPKQLDLYQIMDKTACSKRY